MPETVPASPLDGVFYRETLFTAISGGRRLEIPPSGSGPFEVSANLRLEAGRSKHGPAVRFALDVEAPGSFYALEGIVAYSMDEVPDEWPWDKAEFTAFFKRYSLPILWAACEQHIRSLSASVRDSAVSLPAFNSIDPFELSEADLFEDDED